jgi:hypothetical protein
MELAEPRPAQQAGQVTAARPTRRDFLRTAASLAVAHSAVAEPLHLALGQAMPDTSRISPLVQISTPDKAIDESFWIAAKLTQELRQLATAHYHKEGWIAVSDGKNGPQHSYDPRDFRYGPKLSAYLYGDDPTFALEMGKRILEDQTNPTTGQMLWDTHGQTAIHLAQTVKHFTDYVAYGGNSDLVRDHWTRITQFAHWALATYDRNNDGLIEQGPFVNDHFWSLIVGEVSNFPMVPNCSDDVVVVATMEVCEFVSTMARYAAEHKLADEAWLTARAKQMHAAIEAKAFDSTAEYYYLCRRTPEDRWYHSVNAINEDSRELDVTPYYSSIVSGDWSRAMRVAQYARTVLIDDKIFPMPLDYPTYSWVSPHYGGPWGHIPGGAWEEAYYNCVRAWSHTRLLDAVYEAVHRRSVAIAREKDTRESFTHDGQGRGRDRYGISAMGHLSAIIEGLFGIVPTGFGFDEVDIAPNLPIHWAGQAPASIQVAVPGGGFIKCTWSCDLKTRTIELAIESDRERKGNFRIFVPGPIGTIHFSEENIPRNMIDQAPQVNTGLFAFIHRPFHKDTLRITFESCATEGLPPASCGTLI